VASFENEISRLAQTINEAATSLRARADAISELAERITKEKDPALAQLVCEHFQAAMSNCQLDKIMLQVISATRVEPEI